MLKKLIAVAAVAGGVALVLKRNADAKAEAELWREATSPDDLPSEAPTEAPSTPTSES